MRIALAQINTNVGDIQGNTAKMLDCIHKSKAQGADLIVFPEMGVTGYPPNDLLYDRAFIEANKKAVQQIAAATQGVTAIVGFVDSAGKRLHGLHNSAAIIHDGKVIGVQHKTLLPTYDVFDEHRYFTPAEKREVFSVNGRKIGVSICEDIWDDDYDTKPVKELANKGAELLINISASPFHTAKGEIRRRLLERHARESKLPIVYCNQVGGQDELVFDGHSLALDAEGQLIAEGTQFEEELIMIDLESKESVSARPIEREEEMFKALVLGVRDYYRKQGLKEGVIGLSGGIDSALVAAIAAEAIGPQNVIGVSMPSKISSQHSKDDARILAANLGIHFHTITIQDSVDVSKKRFNSAFGDYRSKITVENLQARERGKILMEIANDRGALVLSTGNKTEMALGYCTLYGDMCGGLAVIADLGKPEVYAIARWINRNKEVIPWGSINKIPSAELAEGQFDPFDYPVISPLVNRIVEEYASDEELKRDGYKDEDIRRCRELIRRNEYKRKQAPIGIKITPKAFGIGRKMPIVNAWRGA